MPFSESLRAEIRRRADMRCCICHTTGVEIHHIIPQAEGGPDNEDNAAPLCPSCHETYGANPTKRKFIREARDNWVAICERQLNAAHKELDRIIKFANDGVTREDLSSFKKELLHDLRAIFHSSKSNELKGQSLGEILQWIYDCPVDTDKVTDGDISFLYMFVWEGSLYEDEVDELKNDFIGIFGKETARRLCRYVLNRHEYSLSKDGFTDPEMSALVNLLTIDMVLLLHHQEIATEHSLEVGIRDKGNLWARLVRPTNSPEGTSP
jgi:hypothetical protein